MDILHVKKIITGAVSSEVAGFHIHTRLVGSGGKSSSECDATSSSESGIMIIS